MTYDNEDANLPALPDDEAANIYKAANTRIPFLKFIKGTYHINSADGEEVPLDTMFWCYASDWRRGWRKWKDNQVVKDLMVRVADDPSEPLERDELGDLDESLWEIRDGERKDCWTREDQLPMENVETGERFLFSTSSFGGRIAVESSCRRWATAVKKGAGKGLPKVKIQVAMMKTKKYGNVPRPNFVFVGWADDDGDGEPIDITPPSPAEQRKKDFHDDEIPFAIMLAIPFIAALIGVGAFVA